MRRAALLLPALLVLGNCALLRSLTGTFEKPKLRYKTVHLRDWTFSSVTLDFEFELENPNSVGITLAKVGYELELDGKPFVKGETTDKVELKAKGTSPLMVPVTVDFPKLGRALHVLLSSRDKLPYRLKLAVGVETPIGVITLPKEIQGELPLPKLPEIRVAAIQLNSLGLTGAELELRLRVTNRASFAMTQAGLRYDLALAGHSVSQGKVALDPIEPGQTAEVAVPVSLSFLHLAASLVQAVRTKTLPYRLVGVLEAGPFKQPFRLEGTARL